MITYRELFNRSAKLKEQIVFLFPSIGNKLNGRFSFYLRKVGALAEAWEKNNLDVFRSKNKMDETVFALKELYEISDILGVLTSSQMALRELELDEFMLRLGLVLEGTNYPKEENNTNNQSRNTLFELRLASKFMQAGAKVSFNKNPDLLVQIGTSKYGFECKRPFSFSDRSVSANISDAIGQLLKVRNLFDTGVVALDFSRKYENGNSWVIGKSRQSMDRYILNLLEKDVRHHYEADRKLQRHEENNSVVSLWLNLSGVYLVESSMESGWVQENGVLTLMNNRYSNSFMKDFSILNNWVNV